MYQPSQREEALFEAALAMPADQRAAWLLRACGDDATLRQRLDARLQQHLPATPKPLFITVLFLRLHAWLQQRRRTATPEAPMGSDPGHFAVKDLPVPRPLELTQGPDTTASDKPILSVHPAPLTEGAGTLIGRYKILDQIGEGGFGVVYIAEQREPVKRRVALKIIKLGMDTKQVVARFEAERQALALMDHPNIAKVLDAGATDTGRPFFVMELVRGIRITDYCDQHNLPTRQRLDLFTQVCGAIQHAHQKGIIHRDIKPSNILVTLQEEGTPTPKVIDFGIAKATQGQLTDKTVYTELQQFIGTPAYMSPEQAEMMALDIDTRSDIYGLGVLLYELLTGKTPFDAQALIASGLDAMRRIIREQEPMRPSTRLRTMLAVDLTSVAKHRQAEPARLASLIRGDLDWIVMKALEKDRTRRYDTANALSMDVERYLTNEPIAARPPGKMYRFHKLVLRHKLAVGAGSVVVASLVTGLGLSIWQWRRAEQANTQLAIALTEMQLERMQRDGPSLLEEVGAEGWPVFWIINGKHRELRFGTGQEARVYDRAKGTPISPPLDGTLRIRSAGFSPDESKLFTFGGQPEVRLWDAITGRLLTRLRHDGPVRFAEFSPDGKRLLTLSEANAASGVSQRPVVAMVWDAESGAALSPPLKNDETSLLYARFTDDGKHLVTISKKGSVAVWDGQSWKLKSIHFPARLHTPSAVIRG